MCVYFGGVWLGIWVFLYEVFRFLELGFCVIEGFFGYFSLVLFVRSWYVLGFWLFLENFEVMKLALHGRGVPYFVGKDSEVTWNVR